jgi:hypothetical protein
LFYQEHRCSYYSFRKTFIKRVGKNIELALKKLAFLNELIYVVLLTKGSVFFWNFFLWKKGVHYSKTKKPKAVYYGAQQWLVTMDSHYNEPPSAQCLKTIQKTKQKTQCLKTMHKPAHYAKEKESAQQWSGPLHHANQAWGGLTPLIAPIGGNVD